MRKKIGVIGGGPSCEHEISMQSAKNVYNVISDDKVFIGITKKGIWYYLNPIELEKMFDKGELFSLDDHPQLLHNRCSFDTLKDTIDIAFPVLHGHLGEDGSVQGLFKCLDIPFVGPGLLEAALTMDKELMKRVAMHAGVQVAPFRAVHSYERIDIESVENELGFPVFVKPSNSGSSLGITKVKSKQDLQEALDEAFRFDQKVLIEKAIVCREIECSVLGNESILVSSPGEVICYHEFYSYEAKYLDENGASLSIPAKLPDNKIEEVKFLAKQAYKAACCQGMARVDFFLDPDGIFYLNEINAIPGFTKISLYPKLWEYEGLTQAMLVEKLIDLGLQRYKQEKKLTRNYEKENLLI